MSHTYDLRLLTIKIRERDIEAILSNDALFNTLYFKHLLYNSECTEKYVSISESIITVTISKSIMNELINNLKLLRQKMLSMYQEDSNDLILHLSHNKIDDFKFSCLVKISKALLYMLQDITGVCSVVQHREFFNNRDEYKIKWFERYYAKINFITHTFVSLYEQNLRTDFTLKVQDNIIQCHKLILNQYGGKFFEKLFSNEFLEQKTRELTFHDYEYETVNLFIEGLYYGPLNVMDKIESSNYDFFKLLQFSDQYDIEWMKIVCLRTLNKIHFALEVDIIKDLRTLYPQWKDLHTVLNIKEFQNTLDKGLTDNGKIVSVIKASKVKDINLSSNFYDNSITIKKRHVRGFRAYIKYNFKVGNIIIIE